MPDARARRRGTPASPRPATVYLLMILLTFQALSGLGGGVGLVADPSGSSIGLEPGWLDGSPFPDYLVPGLVLLIVLGVGPSLVALGVLRRAPWSRAATLLVGLALVIWIGVEILVVGWLTEPPLQLIYGCVGLAILGVALLPSVRVHLTGARDPSAGAGNQDDAA